MDLARYIDHSILKPNITAKELEAQLLKCIELKVYGVCVNPFYVRRAVDLAHHRLTVCAVVSFPLGLDTKEQKVAQAVKALEDGAKELDIVINVSALKSGMHKYVEEELRAVERQTRGAIRKVIIETPYLTTEEKKLAVKLIMDVGMEFVKTSTGFAPYGATEEDVRLLVELAGDKLKVKASGGIRSKEQAIKFIALGAKRIGTSNTFEILLGHG